MTEQESKDLQEMKENIKSLKLSRLDYIFSLAEMSEEQLGYSGHRYGQARAVLDSVNNLKRDVKKIINEHLKKYPD